MKVEVRRRAIDGRRGLELVTDDAPGVLVHTAHLGRGLTLDVDPLAPSRWSRLILPALDDVAETMLVALVGERALRSIRSAHGSPGQALQIDGSDPGPWLRLAVVDALDRWLPLPLDQSFVDAERGLARLNAAATLPVTSAANRLVLGEALSLARRGSAGVAAHLARRRRRGSSLPPPLCVAFESLVEGYRALETHIGGPDWDLAAVPRAWEALRNRGGPSWVAKHARRAHTPWRSGTSMIDPRRVPARLLCLSDDPDAGEVRMSPAVTRPDDLQIEVPAFDGNIDELMAQRLVVRVVDRRTSEPLSHGFLTISPDPRSARRRSFRCTMPLPGPDVSDLRADVFDALAAPPPTGEDGVREARRAITTLRTARRSTAAAAVTDGGAAAVGLGGLLVAELVAAAEEADG